MNMKTYEKIRAMREQRAWTQENVAEKLNISINGYSKIERGETRLNLPRLEQLAEVFEVDIVELLQPESAVNYQSGNHASHNSKITFYGATENNVTEELSKLHLIIEYKDDLLKQKDELLQQQASELKLLREMIALLQKQISHS